MKGSGMAATCAAADGYNEPSKMGVEDWMLESTATGITIKY